MRQTAIESGRRKELSGRSFSKKSHEKSSHGLVSIPDCAGPAELVYWLYFLAEPVLTPKFPKRIKRRCRCMSIAICLLLMYSFLAVLFDLATDRIPNYLVAAELICGLAYQLYIFGPMGILSFFVGIAVPFVLSYALFLFRMIGAGDIKLLMALGSVAGFPRNVRIMVWSVVCGGIISVFIMWRRTGLIPRLMYFAAYVRDFIRTGVRKPYRKEGRRAENFHFTIAIFAAVLVTALTRT